MRRDPRLAALAMARAKARVHVWEQMLTDAGRADDAVRLVIHPDKATNRCAPTGLPRLGLWTKYSGMISRTTACVGAE